MVGGRKSCWARSDNGDSFHAGFRTGDFYLPRVKLIRCQPFEIPNRHRIINFTATAGIFASMGANSTQNTGKRQVFHNNFERLFIFALFYHLHVSLHIQPGRTRQAARGCVTFIYGEGTRYGLRILLVCGFPYRQTFVILIR